MLIVNRSFKPAVVQEEEILLEFKSPELDW